MCKIIKAILGRLIHVDHHDDIIICRYCHKVMRVSRDRYGIQYECYCGARTPYCESVEEARRKARKHD